jgi:hypothetical protein
MKTFRIWYDPGVAVSARFPIADAPGADRSVHINRDMEASRFRILQHFN